MRAHKFNIERRQQQNERNIDNWTYWCHHKGKLHNKSMQPPPPPPPPPKRESLDPSWYTDNIYSNHSLDLEKDMVPDYVKFDRSFAQNYKENTDDDELLFSLPAKPKSSNISSHRAGSYKYPKSRSCCFGSSYESQKPPQLLPKSNTFCNAQPSGNMTRICEAKKMYEPPIILPRRSSQRDRSSAADHYRSDCEADDRNYPHHHPRRRRGDYYGDTRKNYSSKSYPEDAHAYRKRKNEMMAHAQSKADYIRNEWLRKNNTNKNSLNIGTTAAAAGGGGCIMRDKNKNYCDYYRRSDRRQQQSSRSYAGDRSHRNSIFDEDFFMDNDEDAYEDDDDEDDYLDDTNPFGDDSHSMSRHSHRRRSSSYDTNTAEFNHFLNNNARSSLLLNDDPYDNDFLNNFSHTPTKSILRNKTMLEVKPPNRYDETSSDSTDVDLDDFNFDFKKYWQELEKNGIATRRPLDDDDDDIDDDDDDHDHDNDEDENDIDGICVEDVDNDDDLDEQNNNNTYNNLHHNSNHMGVKEKNINLDRYNNGTLIDDNLERTNDTYFMHNNNKNNIMYDLSMSQPQPPTPPVIQSLAQHHHLLHLQQNDPLLTDIPVGIGCSGGGGGGGGNFMIDNSFLLNHNMPATATAAALSPRSPINRLNRKIHPERSFHRNFFTHPGDISTAPSHIFDPNQHHRNATATHLYNQRHNAISLINNIFSIYKPKKYSPVNCHTTAPTAIGIKSAQSKKMNVTSTIRPLGAPQNDFMTSLKRPLLVQPSPCVEQPHFKIIPQKTGLKISPLYRFDFDGDENKFRLKSTARPLLFPH